MANPRLRCGHDELWNLLEGIHEGTLNAAQMEQLGTLVDSCPHCREVWTTDAHLALAADPLVTTDCVAIRTLQHIHGCERCRAILGGLARPLRSRWQEPFAKGLRGIHALMAAVAAGLVYLSTLVVGPSPRIVPQSTFVVAATAQWLLPVAAAAEDPALKTRIDLASTGIMVNADFQEPLILPLDNGHQLLVVATQWEIFGYDLTDLKSGPLWRLDPMMDPAFGLRFKAELAQQEDWLAEFHEDRAAGAYFRTLATSELLAIPDVKGAGDIDGDGHAEVMVSYARSLLWINHDGEIEAAWGPQDRPFWPPHNARVVDLNGDGMQELVTGGGPGYLWATGEQLGEHFDLSKSPLRDGAPVNFRGVCVYNRDGSLRWRVAVPLAEKIAIGDLDLNGKPDIAVSSHPYNNGFRLNYAGPEASLALVNFDASTLPTAPVDDSSPHLVGLEENANGQGSAILWRTLPETDGAHLIYRVPPVGTGLTGFLALSNWSPPQALDPAAYTSRVYAIQGNSPNPLWTTTRGYLPCQTCGKLDGIVWEPGDDPHMVVGLSPWGRVSRMRISDGEEVNTHQEPIADQVGPQFRESTVLASGDIDGTPGDEIVTWFGESFRPGSSYVRLLHGSDLTPLSGVDETALRSPQRIFGARIIDVDGDGLNELLLLADTIRLIRYQPRG